MSDAGTFTISITELSLLVKDAVTPSGIGRSAGSKNIFFVIAEDQSFCGAVAKHDGQHRRATENDLKYKIGTKVCDWVDI